jgi:hypothetical protein
MNSLDKFKKFAPRRKPRNRDDHADPGKVLAEYLFLWRENNRDIRIPMSDNPLAGFSEAKMVISTFGERSLKFVEWAVENHKPLRCCCYDSNVRKFEIWNRKNSRALSVDALRDEARRAMET